MDHLEFAEKAGLENIKFRLQNSESLSKEATSTLTALLAGMGGAMAYVIKGFEQPNISSLTVGAAALATWLMAVALVLVLFCMLSKDLPVPTNEPLNIYLKEFEINKIRDAELRNLDARIKQAIQRNHRVAAWLDRTRLAAIASPVVFAITALAWEAR